MKRRSLEAGDRFGLLTVIKHHHSSKRTNGKAGERVMLCKCDCGKETQVRTSNLYSGNTVSCGCAKSAATTKSNMVRSGAIGDIHENMAYACKCGCASFNILKSKSAECTSCKSVIKISSIFNQSRGK